MAVYKNTSESTAKICSVSVLLIIYEKHIIINSHLTFSLIHPSSHNSFNIKLTCSLSHISTKHHIFFHRCFPNSRYCRRFFVLITLPHVYQSVGTPINRDRNVLWSSWTSEVGCYCNIGTLTHNMYSSTRVSNFTHNKCCNLQFALMQLYTHTTPHF